MNQEEYESLFLKEEPDLKKAPASAVSFSQGNHKRSLVGLEWFYYGETDTNYALYKDVIVSENKSSVFIDIYEDDYKLNTTSIALEKERLKDIYPLQSLFPRPMSQAEAEEILKEHFAKEERSTTIESIVHEDE